MSEIKDRAKIAAKEMIRTGWGRWSDAVTDLLAELERVDQIAAPIVNGDVTAEITRLTLRIAELEGENERLKAWKTGAEVAQGLVCSECKELNFVDQCHDARQQAARECVEIIDKYPAFLFGTDAVGVKLNLSQSIKAHFGLDG